MDSVKNGRFKAIRNQVGAAVRTVGVDYSFELIIYGIAYPLPRCALGLG